MYYKTVILFIICGLVTGISSCKKDDDKHDEIDHEIIVNYVEENGLDGQFTSSGLYYIIIKEGDNRHPDYYSYIEAVYTGYHLDGTEFDKGTIENYPLSYLIKGWQEGLTYIGEGGEIKLIIPSSLAYGSDGSGNIEPNEILIFDIKLNEVYYQ